MNPIEIWFLMKIALVVICIGLALVVLVYIAIMNLLDRRWRISDMPCPRCGVFLHARKHETWCPSCRELMYWGYRQKQSCTMEKRPR